jgi:hypothetical protein
MLQSDHAVPVDLNLDGLFCRPDTSRRSDAEKAIEAVAANGVIVGPNWEALRSRHERATLAHWASPFSCALRRASFACPRLRRYSNG